MNKRGIRNHTVELTDTDMRYLREILQQNVDYTYNVIYKLQESRMPSIEALRLQDEQACILAGLMAKFTPTFTRKRENPYRF